MEPYGGLGTLNVLGMNLDQIIEKLGGGADDYFAGLEGRVKDHAEARQRELTAMAQDIALTFNSEAGGKVLAWMIEKTLLNPALPVQYGKGFDETAPWRAGREFENAFVFQIVLALYHNRLANGGSP